MNQQFIHFFFFNDTATTEIYTLSLHDALPISIISLPQPLAQQWPAGAGTGKGAALRDRESTRLNSSHAHILYGVLCLKKKQVHGANKLLIFVVSRYSISPESHDD